MNNVIATTATFTAIALVALGILGPNLAFAHTAAYNDGYNQGYNNAINNIAIDTGELQGHSNHWRVGYENGWNAGNGTINTNQQSESSSVNIRGNDNRVNIEQGQVSSQGDGANNGGTPNHAPNPRCELLCVSLTVR